MITADLAWGLVAFHTPYVFGGRAEHEGLTCGACHDGPAPSGAAAHIRLAGRLPDLPAAARAGHDIAAFAAHAVMAEFSGPPLAPATARALARLVANMASLPNSTACRIDSGALVGIALGLLVQSLAVDHPDPDALDFLIDSTRFVLGEAAREAGKWPAAAAGATNQSLRDLSMRLESGHIGIARSMAGTLAAGWNAMLTHHGEKVFTVAP